MRIALFLFASGKESTWFSDQVYQSPAFDWIVGIGSAGIFLWAAWIAWSDWRKL